MTAQDVVKALDMGLTRKVSTKYQGRVGAPPPVSAEQAASAARYQGSAKQRRDLAAVAARAGDRPRRMGTMGSPTFDPPVPSPGGGGGGAPAPIEAEWFKNPWLWAAALAGLYLMTRKRKK